MIDSQVPMHVDDLPVLNRMMTLNERLATRNYLRALMTTCQSKVEEYERLDPELLQLSGNGQIRYWRDVIAGFKWAINALGKLPE